MTDTLKKKNLFAASMVDYFLDHLYQKNQDTFEQSRYKLASNLLWVLEKACTAGSIITTPLFVTGAGAAVPATLAGAALIFAVSNEAIELKKEGLSAKALTKQEFQEYSEYIALQLLPSAKGFSDVYEQQISMLSSEIEVRKLAKYCSEGLAKYIKSLPKTNTQVIIPSSLSNLPTTAIKFDVEFLLRSIENIHKNSLSITELQIVIKKDNNLSELVSARELLKHVGLRYQDQTDLFYYNLKHPDDSEHIKYGYRLIKENHQPNLKQVQGNHLSLNKYKDYPYLVYYATEDDLALYIGSNEKKNFKEFIINNRNKPLDPNTIIVVTNGVSLNLKNFANKDFSGVDFTDTNLEGASFSNSILSNSVFLKANLKDVDFNNAILQNAIFDFAQVDNAIFINAKCYAASFNYVIGFFSIKTNYNTDFRQIKIGKELTQSSNYQQAMQDQEVSNRIFAFENALTKADYTISSLASKLATMSLEQKISLCTYTNIIPYVPYYQVTAKDEELFAEIDKSKIVVIKGEPGAGKTQTALKYANDFIDVYKETKPIVWRFGCDTEANFEQTFKEFAKKLGMKLENKKLLEIKKEVLSYIGKDTNKNYLLILDNLEFDIKFDDNNSFYDQLKALTKNNNLIVLITTRIEQASLDSFPSIKPEFTIEEAVEFLSTNSEIMINRESDKNKVIKLTKDLFEKNHPLYLTVAKVYMNRMKISIIQYKEILENEFVRANKPLANKQSFYKRESIKMVISCLSKKAQEVLKFLSLVHADNIPLDLTESFLMQIENQSLHKVKKLHHDIIQEFENLGLTNTINGLNNELFLHREIQQTVKEEVILKGQLDNTVQEIAQILIKQKYFTRDNVKLDAYKSNTKYLFHVESILNTETYKTKFTLELAYLEVARATYYDFTKNHIKAKDILENLKTKIESLVKTNDNAADNSVVNIDNNIICEELLKKSGSFPTAYAQVLYHLGKAYISLWQNTLGEYSQEEVKEFREKAKIELDTAVSIRKIIDDNKAINDYRLNGGENRPMDSTIFVRQGVLLWHKLQKTEESFKIASEGYKELIRKELNLPLDQQDKINLDACWQLYIDCTIDLLTKRENKNIKEYIKILNDYSSNIGIEVTQEVVDVQYRISLAKSLSNLFESRIQEYTRTGSKELILICKIFITIYDLSHKKEDLEVVKSFASRVQEIEESHKNGHLFIEASKLLKEIKAKERDLFEIQHLLDSSFTETEEIQDLFFNNNGLQFLKAAKAVLTEEKFKQFLQSCKDKFMTEQELFEDDGQEINTIINLLLDNQETASSSSSSSAASSQDLKIYDDQLLESIDNLKDFISETELSQNPGFYQYAFNALSNNRFAGAAKQVIHLADNLREYVLHLLESDHVYQDYGINNNDKAISIFEQLGYLLEFMASGQRFIGFVPRYPDFDPGDYSGGGDSSDGNGGNNNDNINSGEPMLLQIGVINTNSTDI